MTVGIKAACMVPGVVKIRRQLWRKARPFKFELVKLLQ